MQCSKGRGAVRSSRLYLAVLSAQTGEGECLKCGSTAGASGRLQSTAPSEAGASATAAPHAGGEVVALHGADELRPRRRAARPGPRRRGPSRTYRRHRRRRWDPGRAPADGPRRRRRGRRRWRWPRAGRARRHWRGRDCLPWTRRRRC